MDSTVWLRAYNRSLPKREAKECSLWTSWPAKEFVEDYRAYPQARAIFKKKRLRGGKWSIQHFRDGRSFRHNHDPVLKGTTTAVHRRTLRKTALQEAVQTNLQNAVEPKQCAALIERQFPGSFQTRNDIYNMRNAPPSTRPLPTRHHEHLCRRRCRRSQHDQMGSLLPRDWPPPYRADG